MISNITIGEVNQENVSEALSFVWSVFQEYEAPDYTKEGMEEFHKSINDKSYIAKLCIYGAFMNGKLVGVIATRNEGTHIALFFVDGTYHRQGIGKELFQTVRNMCHSDKMTVNSSPYAIPVYHKLGFCDTDTEQVINGWRFTSMELRV